MMHTLGRGRLHAVLHLLHLAQREGRARGVRRRAGRVGLAHASQLLRQHARTSCTPFLQYGGPPAFKIRAVLASMMSPSWGVYSGFELFEHVAAAARQRGVPRLREVPVPAARLQRDAPLNPYLKMLNRVRREHPALHQLRNLRVPLRRPAADARVLQARRRRRRLRPRRGQPRSACRARGDGLSGDAGARSRLGRDLRRCDEVTDTTYHWGQANYVRLDPFHEPAHVFTVKYRR